MTGVQDDDRMHPFVALMRRYCIDYTNSHDQSTYPDLFEPDYTVHIDGHRLVRDESYGPAAGRLFALAPGLGLVVHELVLNGDRLCMRFSEHAALPTPEGRRLACWPGIGLYRWNGRRLVENYVEQDFVGQRRQLDSGLPDPLEPPHLDPWMTTAPVAPDPAAERAVRAWLGRGRIDDAARVVVDAGGDERRVVEMVDVVDVAVNVLFSAGSRVAFHATLRGQYQGGLDRVDAAAVGTRVGLDVAGLAAVDGDGAVDEVRAVTGRRAVARTLRSGPGSSGEAGKVPFRP